MYLLIVFLPLISFLISILFGRFVGRKIAFLNIALLIITTLFFFFIFYEIVLCQIIFTIKLFTLIESNILIVS